MNRKQIIAALAGAGVLALGAGIYYTTTPNSTVHAPAALTAVLGPATKVDWAARLTTVAGSGLEGTEDGTAALSRFSDPFGVAIDSHGKL